MSYTKDQINVRKFDVVIVGAGVLGLCTAFELHRRGRTVLVVDPGEVNASLVAAGMIAPAMESAIDDVSVDRARLFQAVLNPPVQAPAPGPRPTPARRQAQEAAASTSPALSTVSCCQLHHQPGKLPQKRGTEQQ